jgi:hypothetical protein
MTPPETAQKGWPVWKIFLALYPFGAGAFAVNVFFLSLIWSWLGFAVLSTTVSIIGGSLLAIPATWWFAGHIRNLMDEADAKT